MATTDKTSPKKLLQGILPSWVEPWFTIPQIVIKILQLIFAVIVVALISSWDSNGVNLDTFIAEDNGGPYVAVIFIASCSLLYVVVMLTSGFVGVSIPPQVRTLVAGFFLLLWVITLPIMSAKVTTSKYTSRTRIQEVSYTQLDASLVIGFLAMFGYLADVLTGLIALNKYHHKRFSKTDMTTEET